MNEEEEYIAENRVLLQMVEDTIEQNIALRRDLLLANQQKEKLEKELEVFKNSHLNVVNNN